MRVDRGKYGTVSLDGLSFAAAYAFPGAVHEGHGTGGFYIDDRSSEEQFTGLSRILTGEAGGGPFEVYAKALERIPTPRRAAIRFVEKELRSRATVGPWAALRLEPLRNPVTGKEHRAIIELPTGFEAFRMDQASVKELGVSDGRLRFRHVGTYASFSHVRWSGP